MSKFKIGDKVRCVNSGDNHYITAGKEYIVKGVEEDCIKTTSDQPDCYCYYEPELFELVESSQKPADLPKYVVVEAKNKEFLQQVNELIAKGYKPQGGVVVDQQFYIQAMVLGD